MPKYKWIFFSAAIVCFGFIIALSIFMTYPMYQKSIEQLPELITENYSYSNPALLKIREQLDAVEESENKNIWTGSVCASKYRTRSGSEKIYYVCPYIVVETAPLEKNSSSDWRITLYVAVSVLKDGVLSELETNISITDIQFSARVAENALIESAGYGDGEMNEVNGAIVSYHFRDRANVNETTNVFARLSVKPIAADWKKVPKKENAVINWSFNIYEKNHLIGQFDDVQIELDYLFNK